MLTNYIIYIAGQGTLFISRFLRFLIFKLGLLHISRLGWLPGGRQDYTDHEPACHQNHNFIYIVNIPPDPEASPASLPFSSFFKSSSFFFSSPLETIGPF